MSRSNNRLCHALAIERPLLGAPMFLLSGPELVAAVSEAGGIGTFPAFNYRSDDELCKALATIRQLTSKPIGINLILYEKHNPACRKQLEIALEHGVELILTSMGTPRTLARNLAERPRPTKLFCSVTTLRQAEVALRSGADGLVAVMAGAGGHAGHLSPFAILPELRLLCAERPLIAAGSITSAEAVMAALMLGADGVSVGTALIASRESLASEGYRAALYAAKADDIELSAEVSGVQASWLRCSLDAFRSIENEEERRRSRWHLVWSAGQGVGAVNESRPAAEIIADLMRLYDVAGSE